MSSRQPYIVAPMAKIHIAKNSNMIIEEMPLLALEFVTSMSHIENVAVNNPNRPNKVVPEWSAM